MEIGPGLSPMAPYTKDFTFIRGLFNQQARDHDSAHMGRTTNLLSGAWVSKDQSIIEVGETMDQVMAKQIGKQSVLPSLVVGIEPTEMRLEDGLSMIYGSNISWSTANKPTMKEIYPARVFDIMIGGGNRELDQSVLDEVLADANYLKNRIAYADKQKLGDYLDSIRDIEIRIENASKENRLEGWQHQYPSPI